jgi:hypothetical protein
MAKTNTRKVVYIAHPIGGHVEENLRDLRRIIRHINFTDRSVVPFAPYYADVVSLDDNTVEERIMGIENDLEIMKSGCVDEVWLTGSHVSHGMQGESDLAKSLGIPVVDKTNFY